MTYYRRSSGSGRGNSSDSANKERNPKKIRIRTFNYDRLARLGNLLEGFDDAITKVLDFWNKHHKKDDD